MGAAIQRRDDGCYLRLAAIEAAMAVLDHAGRVIDASPAARRLLARFELCLEPDQSIPSELASDLARATLGEPISWRRDGVDGVLGCTRYALGAEHVLLLFREITEQQRALSRRLHQQRLESTGRLL